MKTAVRYQSRNGNTRAAAEVIAKTVGVEAKPISEPLDGYVDVLFIGGGVYMGNIDSSLADHLEKLDKSKVGRIAAFSTTGTMDTAIKKIRSVAEKTGIPFSEHTLCLRMLAQGHAMFGSGGKLKEGQTEKLRDFAESVVREA